MIGAVAAFAFGLALVVFPASMLAGSGLATSNAAISVSRGAGATLIGLGLINWMARNATGEALRALLAGNLVVQALSLIVNAGEVVVGQLPVQAIGASLIHAILGVIFVLAMTAAGPRPVPWTGARTNHAARAAMNAAYVSAGVR